MSQIRFIHTADLHLDSPFAGLNHLPDYLVKALRESPFRAFQNIIETAISQKVDFIIIAGDLFDGENRNLRTQVRFRSEMERLDRAGIEVYIIHGNHDHLNGSWIQLELPKNVTVFGGKADVKVYTKQDGTLASLYGFSYQQRHVTERMIDTYRKTASEGYHIGLLHGSLEGVSGHSPYAPFTIKDLAEKDFNYWALGHIHKRQVISELPLAIYPGNIQGRNRKESGPKGCFLIEMENRTISQNFIESAEFIWDTVVIPIHEKASFDEILTSTRDVIEQRKQAGSKLLLELELELSSLEPSLISLQLLDDLLAILQDEAEQIESLCWPYKIKIANHQELVLTHTETPFTSELLALAEGFTDFEGALQSLYKHPGARRYLDVLDEEERKGLLEESRQMLFQLFKT